jgi:GxxExxY protein
MKRIYFMSDSPILKHAAVTEKVLGAFFAVYNELGHGFLESVYRNALQLALKDLGLAVELERAVPVWFRGHDVGDFRCDLVVNGCVILELKTAEHLDRAHQAQLFNYLRATDIEVGLLLNFGPKPEFKRVVFDNPRKGIRVDPRASAVGK